MSGKQSKCKTRNVAFIIEQAVLKKRHIKLNADQTKQTRTIFSINQKKCRLLNLNFTQ